MFLNHYGTIHGQTMTCHVELNFDFSENQDQLPFKDDRIYKVTYKANENMTYFWVVDEIEDVTNEAIANDTIIPKPFKDWKAFLANLYSGGSCKCCDGHK